MLKFTSSWILILILLFSTAQAEETPESAVEPEVKELTKSEQLSRDADQIKERIHALVDELDVIEDSIRHAAGDQLDILNLDRQKKTLAILEQLFELVSNLQRQDALGIENAELRDVVVSYLVRTSNALDQFLDREEASLTELRSNTNKLTGIQLVEFEQNAAIHDGVARAVDRSEIEGHPGDGEAWSCVNQPS